jgi:hypothetical protein
MVIALTGAGDWGAFLLLAFLTVGPWGIAFGKMLQTRCCPKCKDAIDPGDWSSADR